MIDYPIKLANWLMQYADDSLAQGDEVVDYG